jgi:hypothetical protein
MITYVPAIVAPAVIVAIPALPALASLLRENIGLLCYPTLLCSLLLQQFFFWHLLPQGFALLLQQEFIIVNLFFFRSFSRC